MTQSLINEGLLNTLRDFAEYGEEVAAQARVKASRIEAMIDGGSIEAEDANDIVEYLKRLAVLGNNLKTIVNSLEMKPTAQAA